MELNIIVELIVTVVVFLILFAIGKRIQHYVLNSDSRFLNPHEYLPEEEIQSLKQVYYLIMMLILFVLILYTIVVDGQDYSGIALLSIIISLHIALTLDYSSWKNRVLFVLLIPYAAISLLIFGDSLVSVFDLLHIVVYIYLMKMYYANFREYTETNSLGITIILLFTIVFISFLFTSVVESVEPLNALVMVSNAFTSNGYAVLGTTSLGKLNSLLLVWGGYILSGAGTATLTATLLIKHYNKSEAELHKRLDDLEELIKNNNNQNNPNQTDQTNQNNDD